MGRAWSEEDRTLALRAYREGGYRAALALFPNRSRSSVYKLADRAGVDRRRRWSEKEEALLVWMWGEKPIEEICQTLSRGRRAVYEHAETLGLRVGCPHDFEYVTHAARRAGFHVDTFQRILAWARVQTFPLYSRVPSRRTRIVESSEVDRAIAQWGATETLAFAARRLGTSRSKLRQRLVDAGVRMSRETKLPSSHFRIKTDDIDRVWRKSA